jgi:hypothetical protein
MSEDPQEPDTDNGTPHNAPPGMPTWVKILGIVIAALILLAVVVLMVGGEHGPARHAPGAEADASTRVTSEA